MRQLLSWARPKTPAAQPIPLTQTEKTTALHLRHSLHGLPDPLPAELRPEVERLPDKAYSALLRTCIRRGLPKSARTLVLFRPLPTVGRQKLLEQFIDAQWLDIWGACAKEASPELTASGYGYNALLHRVMDTGNLELLQAVLNCLTAISPPVAQYLLELAFKHGRADMFDAVLASRVVQQIRDACMLGCFRDCLFDHRQSQPLALHLLEIGVRPIQSIKDDEILSSCLWLVENHNLPVLKRALELEPPTHESLLRLLRGPLRPGACFDLLCSVSRQIPNHHTRMNRVAFRAAVAFICTAEKDPITLLDQAFQEGASFKDMSASEFEESKLLSGFHWREREGNWIDLIGILLKAGRTEDAGAIKKLKRPRAKKSAS